MEKCMIPARHFGNIMKTMISVYCEKLLILYKISAYIPPMIYKVLVHVIVSFTYWNRGWPLVLFFFFFLVLFYFWKLSEKFWTAEFILFIRAFFFFFFLLLFYRTEVHLHVNSSRRLPISLGSQHEPHSNGNFRYQWPPGYISQKGNPLIHPENSLCSTESQNRMKKRLWDTREKQPKSRSSAL